MIAAVSLRKCGAGPKPRPRRAEASTPIHCPAGPTNSCTIPVYIYYLRLASTWLPPALASLPLGLAMDALDNELMRQTTAAAISAATSLPMSSSGRFSRPGSPARLVSPLQSTQPPGIAKLSFGRSAPSNSEPGDSTLVAGLQSEVARLRDVCRKLRERVRANEYDCRQAATAAHQKLERTTAEMAASADAETTELRTQIAAQEKQLASLVDFRDRKAKYDAALDALREQLDAERKARREEVAALERRYLVTQAAHRQSAAKSFEELRGRARAEAQNALDAELKDIVVQAQRMSAEIGFYRQASTTHRTEREAAKATTAAYAREVSLAADAESLYAKRNATLKRRVQALQQRTDTLEQQLSTVSRAFLDYKRNTSQLMTDATRKLEAQLARAKQLLQLKNKDITTLRHLAEAVLAQRSDVEQYLVDSLQDVRWELASMSSAARADTYADLDVDGQPFDSTLAALAGAAPMPDVITQVKQATADAVARAEQHAGNGAQPDTGPAEVAVADLTPAERERVLRLLLAKIHNANTAPVLPQVPPDSEQAWPAVEPTPFEAAEEAALIAGGIGAPFGLQVAETAANSRGYSRPGSGRADLDDDSMALELCASIDEVMAAGHAEGKS